MSKKVVWILGSGFSKSLGGPLLADLLSHRGEAYTATKFPGQSRAIYDLFRAHLKGDSRSAGNPVYWDHAEEFLDFMNSATLQKGRDRYDILMRLLNQSDRQKGDRYIDHLEVFRIEATQCLAAECLFTTHSSTRSEAWGPYTKWARELDGEHTIVTFNYDLVLEKLASEYNSRKAQHEPRLRFGVDTVVSPLQATGDLDQANAVRILKLHGSVGWHLSGGSFGTSPDDATAANRLREGALPFVVGPGPDKLLHQQGTLKGLWDLAERALRNADVIVFLGYRFPQSDAQSRSVLLEAIRTNGRHNVRVHTVLGPRTNDDDTIRLRQLLEHTLEQKRLKRGSGNGLTYELLPHALLVEDFLTVLHPQVLYGGP